MLVFAAFLLAILSLALGYCVGTIKNERQLAALRALEASSRIAQESSASTEKEKEILGPVSADLDADAYDEATCVRWLALLKESYKTNAFIKGAVQLSCGTNINEYCKQLTAIHERIGGAKTVGNAPAVEEVVEEFRELNDNWLKGHVSPFDCLSREISQSGVHQEAAETLSGLVLNHAAQIETTTSNISSLNIDEDVAAACDKLLIELTRLEAISGKLHTGVREALSIVTDL